METHNKTSSILNEKENSPLIEKNILEENPKILKTLSIDNTLMQFNNGDVYKNKFFESEAKISKLISEIDLLKKKVS